MPYPYSPQRRRFPWAPVLIVAAVLTILAAIFAYPVALHASRKHVTLTVQEKAPSSDKKPYRVFTTDGRTFSVEDSVWAWNFRASDRYGQLRVGATYDCVSQGWRFGPTSSYPNLLECDEVPGTAAAQ